MIYIALLLFVAAGAVFAYKKYATKVDAVVATVQTDVATVKTDVAADVAKVDAVVTGLNK